MARDRYANLPVDPQPADLYRPPGPAHAEPALYAAVAAGGLLGTLARYELALALPTAPDGWPTATFLVNLFGAFALGVLLELLARHGADSGGRRRVRVLLGTGLLGAFTTFSTLAVEDELLIRAGHLALALAYGVSSVLLGAGAAAAVRAGAGVHAATSDVEAAPTERGPA